MLPAWCARHPRVALLVASLASACQVDAPQSSDAAAPDVAIDALWDGPIAACDPRDDPDRDGIPSRVEGRDDTDHDDVPDALDPDADGDGIPDAVEASPARRQACVESPADTDGDGTPDFQDLDANGDTVPDAEQAAPSPGQRDRVTPARDCLQGELAGVRPTAVTGWTCHPLDTDRDGVTDPFDTDIDGDRIPNPSEIMPGGARAPTDTDDNGVPDYRDTDSDGDTIADVHEGALDRDGDGVANFRDRDADGDSPPRSTATSDAREAGDSDPATPPRECARELDARTLDLRAPRPDGVPDYLDVDSDNDGLGDDEETLAETDRCNPDTDGDGVLDAVEVLWCREVNRSRCALDRAQQPPPGAWVALPFMGPEAQRELEFEVRLRAVDVFVLLDTSSRTEAARASITSALSAPRSDLLTRLTEAFPDLRLGAGHFEDFAAASPQGVRYGAGADRPFWPLCAGAPGTPGCMPGWGITPQPLTRATAVLSTVLAFAQGDGGDAPGAQVEALYQTLTGDGLFSGQAATACASGGGRAPCWVPPRQCPEDTRGGACFRRAAMPVVVLATASDFHLGAAEPMAAPWSPYAGVTPTPHSFADLASALGRGPARVVSFNAHPSARCEMSRAARAAGDPCYDLQQLALASDTVDRAGRGLVYDLPAPNAAPGAVAEQIGAAMTALAREVPLDVTVTARVESAPEGAVDVARLARAAAPSCQSDSSVARCWTPPAGVAPGEAVARVDHQAFYRVVPGTRVRFTVSLRNDNVWEGGAQAGLVRLAVEALGDGARLDGRTLYVVVPRRQ